MGDGVIDIPHIRGLVEAAGLHRGFVEGDILGGELWKRDPDEVLSVNDRTRPAACLNFRVRARPGALWP